MINTKSGENISAIIRQYSFPGWQGRIDGKNVTLNSAGGLISLDIPAGQHEISLSFKPTPVRKISFAVSLISWVIFLFIGSWKLSSIAKCTARKKLTGGI